MRLVLESSLSLPGRAGKPNEDAFGAAKNAAWIIDGATGQGEGVYIAGPEETDAAWLAGRMNGVFSDLSEGFRSPLSGAAFFSQAREAVLAEFNTHSSKKPEADYAWPSAAALRIVLDGAELRCDSLGDCTVLLRRENGKIDIHGGDPVHIACDARAIAELVRMRRTGEISAEADPLAARSILLPLIRRNRALANETGGYGSFTLSKPIASGLVRSTIMPATDITHALVMTDGFYALVEDYHDMTNESLFAASLGGGLNAVANRLRDIEDADPKGMTHPRLKKSDDATAVLLRLEH